MVSVRDFNACGDGKTLDTAAVQKAIDYGAERGEKVVLPSGVYRCGTLFLRSNLHLELAEGAVLKGSGDIADYIRDTRVNARTLRFYFLWGKNIENVRISGTGTIDGSGRSFWEDIYFSGRVDDGTISCDPQEYDVLKPKSARPCVIYCENCRNLEFTGFTIVNSPSYTVWCLGCSKGVIEKLTVRNPRNGPNTDVMDIDCSQDFIIRKCDLAAGDDCIALKSDVSRLGRYAACEKITVEDCRLESATCAIRIGYEGDGPIRNCVFRDLEIINTRQGIDILSVAPGKGPSTEIITGTPVNNIRFENITMRNTAIAIFIWAGNLEGTTTYAAAIHDLTFRNIDAETLDGSYIGSRSGSLIRNLRFENFKMTVARELHEETNADFLPSHWGGRDFGAALWLRGVDDVAFDRDSEINVPGNVPKIFQRNCNKKYDQTL